MAYATSKVIHKASALLDHLAREGRSTPAQLASLLAEPRPSVYRLLASLEEVGLVERTPERDMYRLGTRLIRLADSLVHQFDARSAARPVLERLNAETGLTVFFLVRRGFEAVCIDLIPGRWVQSMAIRLGGSLPLHAGAAPCALLAFESDDAIEAYLETNPLVGFTSRTPTTPTAVREKIALLREQGWWVGDGDIVSGLAAIGAPVFDHAGRVCASISVSGTRPAVRGESELDLCVRVRSAADEISRALGHVGDSTPLGAA